MIAPGKRCWLLRQIYTRGESGLGKTMSIVGTTATFSPERFYVRTSPENGPSSPSVGNPSEIQAAVEPLLSVLNDVIREEARSVSADVLDLRTICTSDADFASAIEPSDTGGRKIAAEISA